MAPGTGLAAKAAGKEEFPPMEINKLVVGAALAACVAAAGAGGYLAMRQNPAPVTPAAAIPGSGTDAAPGAGQPVTASEGVIAPETAPTPAAPEPEAAPAPAPTPAPTATTPAPTRRAEAPAPSRARTASSRTEAKPAPAPAATPAPSGEAMWETRPPVEPTPAATEPAEPPAPPAPEYVDLVIPSDSVLGLQTERAISSEAAHVEDRVEAKVTRDVRVDGRVAIPAGAIVQGSVTDVERGGKVREQARLAVRFHTVVLADGTRLNIRTDAITRIGQSPRGESTAKIGGATAGGAILGAILGGGKGAAIGGAIGAAGGTAATMAGGRNPAVLPAGTTLSVRIQQPVTVTVEKD